MVKKILFAILLGTLFSGIRGQEGDEVVEQLLRRVDLVLFLLEQDTVRMERYGLYELQSDVNLVSKDLSREHCVFKIRMTEEYSKARTIAWDQHRFDRVKIVSGKRRAPKTYYILLEKIISSSVQLDDLAMVCFDCTVNLSKTLNDGLVKAKEDLTSTINIMVPAGNEALTMQLILDGRVDAACGLFVQSDVFQDMPLCGKKITKEKALDLGILVVEEAVRNVDQTIEDIEEVPEKVKEVTTSPSVLGSIKSGFVASLDAIKRLFGTSWQKICSCVG